MTRQDVRRDDGELLGFIVGEGDAWTPTTVFGAPISGPVPRDEAEALLRAEGLAVLAQPWTYVAEDGREETAHLVEVSATHVTMLFGTYVADPSTRTTISAPTDRLRPRR